MIPENSLERIATIEQSFEALRPEYPKSVKGLLFPTGFICPLSVNIPHRGGKPAREGLAYMAWLASGTPEKLDIIASVLHIKIQSKAFDKNMAVFHLNQRQAELVPNTSIAMFTFTGLSWMGDVLVVGWDAKEEEFHDLTLEDMVPAMEAVNSIVWKK
ncbi:hypothetical protein B0H11DRAFT_2223931 [Mycena galericulata]|nr:hypothetical protein B0H11DRAFT_2223931 [Mycena galericulata]